MLDKMSSEQYEAAKKTAIECQPGVIKVGVQDIDFTSESISNEIVSIKGRELPVTSGFISDLARTFNVNQKLAREAREGGFYGELLSALKHSKTVSGKTSDLVVVANPETKAVTGLYNRYGRLSNEQLFDIAERLVNDHPGLAITNVYGGGNPTITMQTDNVESFPELGENENFQFGIGLQNVGGTTQIGDYNYRLICTNGMMSSNPELGFGSDAGMGGLTGGDLDDFFGRIEEYVKRGFVPENFQNKLSVCTSTQASFAELENAWHIVSGKLISDGDEYTRAIHEKSLKAKWFWGLNDVHRRLHKAGVNYDTLSVNDKKFIRTAQPVWDVINGLTNLGSNKHVEPLRNKEDLIKAGGKMLYQKEFDLQNAKYLYI